MNNELNFFSLYYTNRRDTPLTQICNVCPLGDYVEEMIQRILPSDDSEGQLERVLAEIETLRPQMRFRANLLRDIRIHASTKRSMPVYYTNRRDDPMRRILMLPDGDTNLGEMVSQPESNDPLSQAVNIMNQNKLLCALKKQVLLKQTTLLREIRASHEPRLRKGGAPVKPYMLTMTVVMRYENDPSAVYPQSTTYKYKSASPELNQNTIDAAVETSMQTTRHPSSSGSATKISSIGSTKK
jgi:hypothetical protein